MDFNSALKHVDIAAKQAEAIQLLAEAAKKFKSRDNDITAREAALKKKDSAAQAALDKAANLETEARGILDRANKEALVLVDAAKVAGEEIKAKAKVAAASATKAAMTRAESKAAELNTLIEKRSNDLIALNSDYKNLEHMLANVRDQMDADSKALDKIRSTIKGIQNVIH